VKQPPKNVKSRVLDLKRLKNVRKDLETNPTYQQSVTLQINNYTCVMQWLGSLSVSGKLVNELPNIL